MVTNRMTPRERCAQRSRQEAVRAIRDMANKLESGYTPRSRRMEAAVVRQFTNDCCCEDKFHVVGIDLPGNFPLDSPSAYY